MHAYEDLQRFILFAMQLIEGERQTLRHPKVRQTDRPELTRDVGVPGQLDSIAQRVPKKVAADLRKIAAHLRDASTSEQQARERMLEGYTSLAAAGHAASLVGRSMTTSLEGLENVYEDPSRAQPSRQHRRRFQEGGCSRCAQADDSAVDGRVIEIGQVCYQHPLTGRVQGARLPITLRVQTENPWQGNAGKPTEWRLMPDLVGKSVDEARAEMKRVGFSREDSVQLQWVDEPGCKPLIVCRTYPDPMQRAGLGSGKIVFAGRDPNATIAKPVETQSEPAKPRPAKPDPAPVPSNPTPSKAEVPKPPAEPFF